MQSGMIRSGEGVPGSDFCIWGRSSFDPKDSVDKEYGPFPSLFSSKVFEKKGWLKETEREEAGPGEASRAGFFSFAEQGKERKEVSPARLPQQAFDGSDYTPPGVSPPRGDP